MAKLKLTDTYLRNLKPSGSKQVEIFDTQVTGLSVRHSPGGKIAFCLQYRMDGKKNRRLTLGRYPQMSLSEARTAASQARQTIQTGNDPASLKQQTRSSYEARLFPASSLN